MATKVKKNVTILVCLFVCFVALRQSTDIAMPGYYLHFQHWDAMTSETYSNYITTTTKLGSQSYFICFNHFFQADSDQSSNDWSVSFNC